MRLFLAGCDSFWNHRHDGWPAGQAVRSLNLPSAAVQAAESGFMPQLSPPALVGCE